MRILSPKAWGLGAILFASISFDCAASDCKNNKIRELVSVGNIIEPKVYFECDQFGISLSFDGDFKDPHHDSLFIVEDRARGKYFAREFSIAGICKEGPVVHRLSLERSVDWNPYFRRFRTRDVGDNSGSRISDRERIELRDFGLSCEDFSDVEIYFEWRHWAPAAKFNRTTLLPDWRLMAVVSVGQLKYRRVTEIDEARVVCELDQVSMERNRTALADETISFCLFGNTEQADDRTGMDRRKRQDAASALDRR